MYPESDLDRLLLVLPVLGVGVEGGGRVPGLGPAAGGGVERHEGHFQLLAQRRPVLEAGPGHALLVGRGGGLGGAGRGRG